MVKKLIPWIIIAGAVSSLIGGTFLYVRGLQVEAARSDSIARAEGLRSDSISASLDSTRVVMAGQIRVYQRRTIQASLRADSLDAALGLETRARVRVEAEVEEFEGTLYAPPVSDSSIRRARFQEYQEPYTVDAEVVIPWPPISPAMRLRIALDPIPLGVRLGCGLPDGSSVRPATVSVVAPKWAPLRLDSLRQDPDVCNTPVIGPGDTGRDWGKIAFAASAGVTTGLGILVLLHWIF